jgi:hypothetical protein
MASSPTRSRRHGTIRACETQKVCFASRELALDAAEMMMERGNVSPGCHITPYPCEDCGRWHVGNRQIVYVPRRA